ncbi:MAG: hypothetical protein LBT48_03720 [Prevotellaceae bacterium]|jgi:hypothetical protein|nr:hypothetical protein [Prevotellaceae bacterium]
MDYNSKISTKYVSHFTSEFENLKGIIENGFKSNENKELAIDESPTDSQKIFSKFYTQLTGITENEYKNTFNSIPMVCFCDIPKKLIKQHLKEYGEYGIGLTKEWAIKCGISPVIYLPQKSRLHSLLNSINKLVKQLPQLKEQIDNLREYIKPYMNDKENKKYYDEREWRYVPPLQVFDTDNTETYLKFEKEDICFIVVKTSKEKKEIQKILQAKFEDIKHIKFLFSKTFHC